MSGVRASRLQVSSIFMLADHGYLEFRFTFLRVIVMTPSGRSSLHASLRSLSATALRPPLCPSMGYTI